MSMCEWSIGVVNDMEVTEYALALNIPKLCISVLYARGLNDPQTIIDFLNPKSSVNPFDFTDMKKAIDCLNSYIESREKICIYGDYDADGITSTALMYYYLKSCGANVEYYIPNRNEGYGLNCSAIKELYNQGTKLLLTVDNGVSAYEEIEFANSLGIKVLVTDHHKIPSRLPPAEAIINPCRESWSTIYGNFAGVGVVYKFIEAVEIEKNSNNRDNYLDLVALGTIGDSIQLFGESRDLVKKGIKNINNSTILGINSFLSYLGLKNKKVNSIDLAFKIVPRINASGRMESADLALKLLISNDEEECKKLCANLEQLNNIRKSIEEEIIGEIEKELQNNSYKKYDKIIVIKGKEWHHGVLGIAAARIVQKYNKPCILISYSDNGEARGSCRSVDGFSIYDIILSCSEYLERFGGHPMAAGINLKTENVDKFIYAIKNKSKDLQIGFQKLSVDLELDIKSLTLDNLNSLDYLEPFGTGNPKPIFILKNLKLKKIQSIGKGDHLKLVFCKDTKTVEMLYFNKKKCEFLYRESDLLDVAVTIHKNLYKSINSVSVYIVDLRFSNLDISKAIHYKGIYEKFKRDEVLNIVEANSILPDRKDFIRVYKYLKNNTEIQFSRIDVLSYRIFDNYEYTGKIYVILDVFESFGLINIFWNGDDFQLSINTSSNKVSLESSEILKVLIQMKEGTFYE